MSIIHNWSINSTIKYLDRDGTVCKVIFTLESYDDENPELLNITTTSSVDLDTSYIENLIPFDQLREFEVLDWVFDRLPKYQTSSIGESKTKCDYEIYHEKHLEKLKNPISFVPELPNTIIGYLNKELDICKQNPYTMKVFKIPCISGN